MFIQARLSCSVFTLVSNFWYQFINPIISTKQNVDVYRCIAIFRDLTRTPFVSMTFSLRYRCTFYVCHFSRWYFWNFRILLYSIVQMHAWDCSFLQPMLRDNSLFTQLPIESTLIHTRGIAITLFGSFDRTQIRPTPSSLIFNTTNQLERY